MSKELARRHGERWEGWCYIVFAETEDVWAIDLLLGFGVVPLLPADSGGKGWVGCTDNSDFWISEGDGQSLAEVGPVGLVGPVS
jgi:hypothetical protein